MFRTLHSAETPYLWAFDFVTFTFVPWSAPLALKCHSPWEAVGSLYSDESVPPVPEFCCLFRGKSQNIQLVSTICQIGNWKYRTHGKCHIYVCQSGINPQADVWIHLCMIDVFFVIFVKSWWLFRFVIDFILHDLKKSVQFIVAYPSYSFLLRLSSNWSVFSCSLMYFWMVAVFKPTVLT